VPYDSRSFDHVSPPSSALREANERAAFAQVKDSMKSILRHDGDDVSMEQQVNEIMKNQQQHNLAVSIMSAQFRLLRAAITERVA
jgi:flagellar basal-body rod protein FlgB